MLPRVRHSTSRETVPLVTRSTHTRPPYPTDSFQKLTPGLHYKIPVFSDPDPGKSYATTYEQMGS